MKTLTIKQAAREAHERGIVGDYYELDGHALDELDRLLARTKWRQSTASARMGRSRRYSFHQALKRSR